MNETLREVSPDYIAALVFAAEIARAEARW